MNPNDSLTTRPSALRRLRAGLIGSLCSLFLALLAGQAWATPCDLDQDGDVDLDDVTQLQRLLPSRPTVNGPDDPRDPDRNGRIDIGDVRACVLRCTQPRCARISPTPPTVSLTAPVADARYLAPATITLAANASGAAPLTRVEFLADGTVIATVGNSPYTVDWPNVAAGTYQLSARATDRDTVDFPEPDGPSIPIDRPSSPISSFIWSIVKLLYVCSTFTPREVFRCSKVHWVTMRQPRASSSTSASRARVGSTAIRAAPTR